MSDSDRPLKTYSVNNNVMDEYLGLSTKTVDAKTINKISENKKIIPQYHKPERGVATQEELASRKNLMSDYEQNIGITPQSKEILEDIDADYVPDQIIVEDEAIDHNDLSNDLSFNETRPANRNQAVARGFRPKEKKPELKSYLSYDFEDIMYEKYGNDKTIILDDLFDKQYNLFNISENKIIQEWYYKTTDRMNKDYDTNSAEKNFNNAVKFFKKFNYFLSTIDEKIQLDENDSELLNVVSSITTLL